MSYLDQLDDYTRASLDGSSVAVPPRTDSRTAATTVTGSGGAAEDVIRRYTDRDGSEDANDTIVGTRPDSGTGAVGGSSRTSAGEGRYTKRLGMLGNHSLPVVALGVDPSDDDSPPPPLPKNLDTDALAPNHLDLTPSPGSEDLTFDLGNLSLGSTSTSAAATSTLPPRSDSIPTSTSLPPVQPVGRLTLDINGGDEDGGIRSPSNTNRGSIWDPNLGSGLRGIGSRTPGSAGYDDLRRRASANSALSEGTRGTANLSEVERRDSLQSTFGGAAGSTSERGSLAGAEDDLALAAAMLQKRGSSGSESYYEAPGSRRESANTNEPGGGTGSSSSEPLTALPPRGPSLPSNPAAALTTPRLSDSSRMQSSPYASAGGTGSGASSIRQSAEASGSASGHAPHPSYPNNYPADDNMSVMGGHPGYSAYAGYPGAVPPSAGAQHDYDYAYYMQQQQAQAMAGMHPGYAGHPQQAWYGHPQYAADPAAAAYYQQQQAAQAAAYQASMAGYPAGYYGHEYAAANPYYAGSVYSGYAPSAYAGGSSGASVVGVSGQMANIPRRRGPASIASSDREAKAPERERVITKQSIDEYRNRIKNDQDPEAHFNFAKYLIEAAKKFGAAATSGEDANSKALRKYRDALLAESLKLIRRLATQGVGLGKPAYADAQFFLANCLGNGSLGLQPDHEKAYNLYVQASKQNHPQATYRTAVCNERGAGTRRDHNRAVLFYRKASALGDTPGMYKLGMILLNGLLGQQRNVKEAVVWLKRAASQADEENPHALFELGQLLENPPREIPWVRQLITDCRDPDPMVVEASAFAAARDFYTSAGQFGHDRSQHRLGQLYEYGKLGCPIDPRRSIAWYTRAAERGLDQAELSLSGWYLTGAEGVLRQSDNEAYLWARRAANKGLPEAELAVGVYYERGIGVDRDLEEAKKWFMRAAAQGNRKAMQRLTDLRRGDQPSKRGNSKVTRQQAEAEGCTVM